MLLEGREVRGLSRGVLLLLGAANKSGTAAAAVAAKLLGGLGKSRDERQLRNNGIREGSHQEKPQWCKEDS